jgi:hypothetical protein
MQSQNVINVGDRVRSYDFPDISSLKDSCFVEGIVEAVGHVDQIGGPDRYTIRVERRVWRGQECSPEEIALQFLGGRAYPPVNGIPTWLGGVTRGVEKIESNPQTQRRSQ